MMKDIGEGLDSQDSNYFKGLFVLRGELVDYIEQLLKTFYRISEFFD